MSKIMIVDDDPNIRELVCALLHNGGFAVCEAKDGRDALQRITVESPDLAIIDLMMPHMDGYELCQKLRKYYEHLPVLMLTAKAELPSKAKGFDAGADDYLTKPFEGDELLMRVRALLRRYIIEASQTIQIGNVVVDKNSFAVTVGGVKADIPMKEFELLFKLAGFPGKTFSRDQLIEDVLLILNRLMPMTYCLDLSRAVIYAGSPEYSSVVMFNPAVNFAAIAALTVVCLVIGTYFFAQSEKNR